MKIWNDKIKAFAIRGTGPILKKRKEMQMGLQYSFKRNYF